MNKNSNNVVTQVPLGDTTLREIGNLKVIIKPQK